MEPAAGTTGRRWSRGLSVAAVVLALLAAGRLAQAFFAQPEADLISFDQAARAEESVRLAKELKALDLPRFALHVLSLNWWPPLHPLIMLPFVLLLGPSIEAAVVPSLLAFVLAVLGILFLFRSLSTSAGADQALGGAFLMGVVLTSPLLLSSATWAMLEVFGIGLTCFALGFYFRGIYSGRAGDFRACAILVFSAWLLKYNYGLFLSLTILLFEVRRSLPEPWRPRFRMRSARNLLRPVLIPVYLLVALMAWIALGGGFEAKILGSRVSISGLYNPLLYLYLYVFLVGVLTLKKNWARVKLRLLAGQRELLVLGALPVGIFLALPDKIKAVIMNFEAGHREAAGTAGSPVVYYLRSICRDYSLWVPVGLLVLALGFLALARLRRLPGGVRVLLFFFLAGWLSLILGFKLKEGRYLATFVPALWVSAAWSVEALVRRIPGAIKATAAAAILASLALMFVLSPWPVRKAIEQPWAPWAHHGSDVRPVLDSIVDGTRDARRLIILGTRDWGLGPLLGWKLQSAHFGQRGFRLELIFLKPGLDPGPVLGAAVKRLQAEAIVLVDSRGVEGAREGDARDRAGRGARRRWRGLLDGDERYVLDRRVVFREPTAWRLAFFKRRSEPISPAGAQELLRRRPRP